MFCALVVTLKTRLNGLSYGIKIWTDLSSVLLQSTRLTDGQTDGRTDTFLIASPRWHSMQHGKKRSADEIMRYFHNLSSASGDCPDLQCSSIPGPRWEIFVLRPLIYPPHEKKSCGRPWRPMPWNFVLKNNIPVRNFNRWLNQTATVLALTLAAQLLAYHAVRIDISAVWQQVADSSQVIVGHCFEPVNGRETRFTRRMRWRHWFVRL